VRNTQCASINFTTQWPLLTCGRKRREDDKGWEALLYSIQPSRCKRLTAVDAGERAKQPHPSAPLRVEMIYTATI